MFKVWLVNHYYYSEREFDTLESAADWAKSTAFDCRIDTDGETVAFYSYFGGLRMYDRVMA